MSGAGVGLSFRFGLNLLSFFIFILRYIFLFKLFLDLLKLKLLKFGQLCRFLAICSVGCCECLRHLFSNWFHFSITWLRNSDSFCLLEGWLFLMPRHASCGGAHSVLLCVASAEVIVVKVLSVTSMEHPRSSACETCLLQC